MHRAQMFPWLGWFFEVLRSSPSLISSGQHSPPVPYPITHHRCLIQSFSLSPLLSLPQLLSLISCREHEKHSGDRCWREEARGRRRPPHVHAGARGRELLGQASAGGGAAYPDMRRVARPGLDGRRRSQPQSPARTARPDPARVAAHGAGVAAQPVSGQPDVGLGMATGTNLSGFTIPNPNPCKISKPIKKPITVTGLKFCPNPYPSG
jgi:hypothetical protein